MIIYLPCVASLITYYIFSSRGIDYRAVAIGSLLPYTIDLCIGHASFGHSFLFPVSALCLIMLATMGRSRLLRRRLLCVVIGIFFALVLEGTFLHESLWWWPSNIHEVTGIDILPSPKIWIIRDVVGVVCGYILLSIGELYKKKERSDFYRTGRLASHK